MLSGVAMMVKAKEKYLVLVSHSFQMPFWAKMSVGRSSAEVSLHDFIDNQHHQASASDRYLFSGEYLTAVSELPVTEMLTYGNSAEHRWSECSFGYGCSW